MTDSSPQGFAAVLGVRDLEAEDRTARLRMDATEEHLNEGGPVHGVVLATLVNMAMGRPLADALATFAVLHR